MRPPPGAGLVRAREVLKARENLNLFGVSAGAPRETGRPGDRSFSWRHERTGGNFLAPTTGGGDAAFRAALLAGPVSARLLTSSSSPPCAVRSICEHLSIRPLSVPT